MIKTSRKEQESNIIIQQIWKANRQKGITLIALVVTIIVLLILAGVAISLTIGNNGLFSRAQNATAKYEETSANEQSEMDKAIDEIDKVAGGNGGGSEEETTGVAVTLEDGTSVTLTEENYADYLGKIVTNYKTTDSTETVKTTTENYSEKHTFTVSTTYRLYYIDWNNKYGDGEGTVYLKADTPSNIYSLCYTHEYNETDTNVKLKNLNPSLYAEGVTAPTSTNNNMKAVSWLLDTAEWSGLKSSEASEVSTNTINDKINYIVGAPSLEMMMDSFNTKYKLSGESPSVVGSTRSSSSDRIQLFYNYVSGKYGYEVSPAYISSSSYSDNYSIMTGYYTVQTDSDIDSMYYPGDSKYYWLASPSAYGSSRVMFVSSETGGFVWHAYINAHAFCPLVSLSSDVQLKLK